MLQTNYPLPNAFEKCKNLLYCYSFLLFKIFSANYYFKYIIDNSSTTLSSSSPIEYYYYEITILSNQNIDETIIAIGLASKNCSNNRYVILYKFSYLNQADADF
jgi:hypothetical protein